MHAILSSTKVLTFETSHIQYSDSVLNKCQTTFQRGKKNTMMAPLLYILICSFFLSAIQQSCRKTKLWKQKVQVTSNTKKYTGSGPLPDILTTASGPNH